MQENDKRLILVSNRLPYRLLEKDGKITIRQNDGGLVTALMSFFEHDQGSFKERRWIGAADFTEKRWHQYQKIESADEQAFHIDPLFIPARLYDKYYNGFCNTMIWPLFHYFSTYVIYDEEHFDAYEQVNQMFADRLVAVCRPGDVIWIHDYHHFLLPGLIRDRIPGVLIGFFLHIPFPSYEIFRLIHRKWKEKIIHGMLGADLVGFHTHEYVQHFLKTVRMIAGYDHHFRSITIHDRIVKTDMFPLGIDFDKFHNSSSVPSVQKRKLAIRKNFGDKKIIFSVDRLDYTKGVNYRLSGFVEFLERFPEWREKVVFIMVMVPSRHIISKYNERKSLIEEQVGQINGKYSTLQWQPVIYRYSQVPFDELCALYQSAEIALITPLRDGMNLVAKEYVASLENGGVLILSELAGAASELGEALLVNPTDKEEMATAIQQALLMPQEEQHEKILHMQKRLRAYTVVSWVTDFLSQLEDAKLDISLQTEKFIGARITDIIADFQSSNSRHLFLDYDGTLVPFAKRPQDARPDAQLLELLHNLTSETKNTVTIISGRDSEILQNWFGDTKINLIAEHGASVRIAGDTWTHEINAQDHQWKEMIKPTLELFTKRSPGSFVEEKNHTLAWHYRNVQHELGFIRSRELLDSLMHFIRNAQLQVIDGNKVIEVRISGMDKGAAARKLIESFPSNFVLAIGDDKTDEDMFRALAEMAVTIKVGPGHTQAQYMIPSQKEVLQLLKHLVNK